MEIPQPPWANVLPLITCTVTSVFLCLNGISRISKYVHCFLSCHWASLRSTWFLCLYSPHQVFTASRTWDASIPSRSFSGPTPVYPCFPSTGVSRTGPSTPKVCHQCWTEGRVSPLTSWQHSPLQPQVALVARVHCWLVLTFLHHAWCILAQPYLYLMSNQSVPNHLPGTGTQIFLSHTGCSRLEVTLELGSS